VIYREEIKLLKTANVHDDYLKDILPNKLRLDQLYVRNHNFLSDLDLIFYTLTVFLPGLRKNSIPTESLYIALLFLVHH
jgi:lipopolysaccharide/colanic/teichoic acid biosynthesis glycosyltransferase